MDYDTERKLYITKCVRAYLDNANTDDGECQIGATDLAALINDCGGAADSLRGIKPQEVADAAKHLEAEGYPKATWGHYDRYPVVIEDV